MKALGAQVSRNPLCELTELVNVSVLQPPHLCNGDVTGVYIVSDGQRRVVKG